MTGQQQESCNKFLVAWMKEQGEDVCWHEWDENDRVYHYFKCQKCNALSLVDCNPNYFDPAQFWDLWKAARKSEEWNGFWNNFLDNIRLERYLVPEDYSAAVINRFLKNIDLAVFPYEWAKFLGW